MATQGYKKYMKKSPDKNYNLLKLFIISFVGMLLVFTFIIKTFSSSLRADVSVGDYKQEEMDETSKNVDGRLAMLQDEDQGKDFTELTRRVDDTQTTNSNNIDVDKKNSSEQLNEAQNIIVQEPIYKVYIGSYTSAEQAKVAKDIIQDTGTGLSPIVKCIGSNNYTLQVGIFKNRNSAENLLLSVQQNHLPGRIVQEY